MKPAASRKLSLSAPLSLRRAGAAYLAGNRIALLEEIERHGSITGAARAAGISYKTAWDIVDAVNNIAETPLVRRSAGGRGGGGTVLTDAGKEAVRMYRVLQGEHQKFVDRIEQRLGNVERLYALFRRTAMRVSARNVFLGTVKTVKEGAVSTEVTVSLKGGETVCSVITNDSARTLGLRKGMDVYALFKASSVIIGRDLHIARTSARNVLCGSVTRIKDGPVNAEVTVTLGGGSVLTAVITEESAKALKFAAGDHACALVKASSVILGVDG